MDGGSSVSEQRQARPRGVAKHHPASPVPLYYFKWSDTLNISENDQRSIPGVRVGMEEFDASLNLASVLAPDLTNELGSEGVEESCPGNQRPYQDGSTHQLEPEVIPSRDGAERRLPVAGQATFNGLGSCKDFPQVLGFDDDQVM